MDPLLIVSLLVILWALIGISWFAGSDAPFIPTKKSQIKKVLKAAGLKKGQIFYELGSGDGRVVLEAGKMGAVANGVEQSWIRVWYSRFKAWRLKLNKVSIFHGDIFQRHYFPADVVYIYLLTEGVLKLERKLKKELKNGAVVITQTYHFKKWPPFKKLGHFYFYKQSLR